MKLTSNFVMNALKKALSIIVRWIESKNIHYMVIGGIAKSLYGIPRVTYDIDIKVSFESSRDIKGFIEELSEIACILPKEPDRFIQETNVLPVEVENVKVDFVFAELPYEIEAIQRSLLKDIFGVRMKVCTPEDLIIHKAISTRSKDWSDIEDIIDTQRESLDWDYLLAHCRDLSEFLNDPSVYTKIRNLKDAESL